MRPNIMKSSLSRLTPVLALLAATSIARGQCFTLDLDLHGQVTGVGAGAPAPYDTLVPGDVLSGELVVAIDIPTVPFGTKGRTYFLDYQISDIDLGGALLVFDLSSPHYALNVLGTGPGSDTIDGHVLLAGGGSMHLAFADATGATLPTSTILLGDGYDFLAGNGAATIELRDDQGTAFVTVDLSTFRLLTCGLGSPLCTGLANSTGAPGRMVVDGDPVAAHNDVRLIARDLPPNVFGYFIVSPVAASNPFPVDSGLLCLASSIGRYVDQVRSSGPAGEYEIHADLTRTPTPTGFVSVMAGETWHFQSWHRDVENGLPTSNFTGATSVTFQ